MTVNGPAAAPLEVAAQYAWRRRSAGTSAHGGQNRSAAAEGFGRDLPDGGWNA